MWKKRHFNEIISFDAHSTANLPLLTNLKNNWFKKPTFVRISEILLFQSHSTTNFYNWVIKKFSKTEQSNIGHYQLANSVKNTFALSE